MTVTFAQELEKRRLEIFESECKSIYHEEEINEGRKMVSEAFKKVAILGLTNQAGYELYVNYYAEEDKNWIKFFLHTAIENFMDPYVVEEAAMLQYFTLKLEGYEAITYLLTLYGVCSLMRGIDRCEVLSKIYGLYPRPLDKQTEEELKEIFSVRDLTHIEVNNLYESGLIPVLSRKQYFFVTTTEKVLNTMDDYFVVRLFLNIDAKQGALILKGLSDKAGNKIRKNITRRLEESINEELESMKVAKVENIVNEIKNLFNIMVEMMQEKN